MKTLFTILILASSLLAMSADEASVPLEFSIDFNDDGPKGINMNGDEDPEFVVQFIGEFQDNKLMDVEGGYVEIRSWTEGGGVIIDGDDIWDVKQVRKERWANRASILDKGVIIDDRDDYEFDRNAIIASFYSDVDVDVKEGAFFHTKTSGYIGCRYTDDIIDERDDKEFSLPDRFYYGWIKVEIDYENEKVTFMSSGAALSMDEPIAAGDTPVVPIPVLASLLGFAAVGFTAMRKRIKK